MGHFRGRGIASLMMMMMMMLMASKGVLATNYKVGDGTWTIMSYDSWLSGKTFKVNDTLEFVYSSSSHNVVEVNAADYDSCAQGTNKVYTDGDTKFTLSTVGTMYYICSVPTHCENGMKLAVKVEAASSTTPSTPSTSPTTPSTTSNNNTTPSSPSSSPPSSSPPLWRSSLFLTLLPALALSIVFFQP